MERTAHKYNGRHGRHHPLSQDFDKIKSAFTGATYNVKDKATEAIQQSLSDLKQKTVDVKDNIGEYTAERPFKSLGIALLTGVVIGFLIRK